MRNSHARLGDNGADEEEEGGGGGDRRGDGVDGSQLLQQSDRSEDDQSGDENDQSDDEYHHGADNDRQYAPNEQREESSFWDTDDSLPVHLLPPPRDDHSIIDVLADELLQREIPEYMEEFEIVIPDAEIIVGSVPLEEVQQREHMVEEARLRHAELESDLYRQREMHLAKQEECARARLLQEAKKRQEELVKQKMQFVEVMQLRTRRLGYVFQQAENHLKDELQRQQARVERVYGDLTHSRVPQSRKRYRVEWEKIPVTIKIRARMLKALKDKLPSGHYVLVATLYDRLGGHALHWSAWDPEYNPSTPRDTRKRQHRRRRHPKQNQSDESGNEPLLLGNQMRCGKPNFTRPFQHRGRFYNTEATINQNVYVVCPPECTLRPGNVLIFELFHLSSEHTRRQRQQTDQVVAWGAMPLATPDFQCIQGKYKIPLLRGEMDPTMDKFRDIEQMYQDDLSSWLCNLYFHVTHVEKRLPSKISNSHDDADAFDLEIDESSGLYRLENNHQRYMRKLTKRNIALEKSGRNVLLLQDEEHGDAFHGSCAPSHIRPRRLATKKLDGDFDERRDLESVDDEKISSPKLGGASVVTPYPSSRTLLLDDSESNCASGEWRKDRRKGEKRTAGSSIPFAPALSALRKSWKHLTSPKKTRVYSGEMVEKKDRLESRETGVHDVSDTPRLSSRARLNTVSMFASGSEHEEGNDSSDEEGDKHSHQGFDVENYKFAVNAATSVETAHQKRFHMQRKLYYLRHELLVDLGASNYHTLEFWRLVALLLFTLWIRVYVHYVMQWIFLRGNRIPVYDFRPQWSTCLVKYTWRTIATHTEIGVIAFGALGNIFLFGFLALAAAVGQRFVGELPHFGSNFIVCVGIATILDPYLVLLVDVIKHHYSCSSLTVCVESLASSKCKCVDGDAFKLYVRFLAQEGSGLVGIVLTVFIYAALTCLALVCVYAYLLHIHMNGRMLDVYRRIHGQEEAFFVPHDGEIGLQDLKAICDQACRWKGPRGTQRKVFVHEYVLTDPLDPGFEEKNVHIAVYNMELDGKRELHRHFLKSNDGSIIELFGEVGTGSEGAWQHDANSAMSLALLYNAIQDQQGSVETTAEDLATLFDGL